MRILLMLCIFSVSICRAQENPKDTVPTQPVDTTKTKTGEPDFGKGTPNEKKEVAETGKDQSKVTNILSPLINYNFTGQDKGLANLTPSIDYGFSLSVGLGKMKTKKEGGKDVKYRDPKKEGDAPKYEYVFEANPYVAGQIDVKDSVTYIPALMLPGNAGIRIDNYLNWRFGKCMFSFFPLNLGLKFITNFTDSSKTILQHNIRSGFSFTVSDLFVVGFQHTMGWHNLTSTSETVFDTLFKKRATDMRYLLVSLQIKITKNLDVKANPDPAFLYVEWRSLLNKEKWSYPNAKIITVGIRKDISFRRTSPARSYDPRNKPAQ